MACSTCSPCNNINCDCNAKCGMQSSSNMEERGTKQIIDSHMVCNNTARAVFFKNGGCGVIPKGYIPAASGTLTGSNGPKIVGCAWGTNPSPESEGQDCLNYKFNKNRYG